MFITTYESGRFERLPVKSSKQKVVKQLFKHRRFSVRMNLFHSHVTISGVPYPYIVYALAFVKNGRVTAVWDARLNGYRPKAQIKKYARNILI